MAKRIERVNIAQDDIFGKIKESAKNAETEVDALNLTLQSVNAQIDEIKKKALNVKVGSGAKSLGDVKAVNEAEKEAIRLAQEREKLEKMRIQTIKLYEKAESDAQKRRERDAQKEAKIHAQREKQYNKEIEQANQAGNAYKQASTRLNELRNSYKDLAIQGRENESASKAMKREIDSLDKTLKRVDASVGQFQRNVGNYSSAFSKMGGILNTFGIGLGVGVIGNQFLSIIKENEDAVASFRTIVSDLNDTQFSKFENEITRVAGDTKRSTIEIAQSFETIAGLNAEFASTSTGIGQVSEAVSTLSKASKGELQPTAENLVGIMNQFDLSADQANRTINVLAAGQAVGASSIQQSAEAYKNFGSVAKASNIDLEKSQALIQVLGKFSIFGAEAGTKLRGVTLQLQKANLGYASGQFNINDALAEYNEKISKKSSQQEKDALSLKVFGAENITAGKIISANIPLLEKFEKGVTGTDEAQKAAAINSNTLSNRWQELKNQATNLITTNSNVNGGMNVLKDTLVFVTDNLGTIISMVGKLIIAWGTYRTIQGVVNTDFKALISNFTNLKKGADDAGKSTGGFGNALKGVGWTVAIGLAYELVAGFYEMATASDLAAENMEKLNKAVENGNKFANDRISVYKKQLEAGKIDKQLYKEKIQAEIELARESRNSAKERALQLAKEIEETSSWNIQRRRLLQNQLTNQQEVARREEETIKALKAELIDREETEKSIEQENKARAREATNQKKLDKENKELERKKQNLKDLADFEQEQADKQKKLDEEKKARQEELGILIEEAKKTDREYAMTEEEKEIQALEDKYRRMEDLIEEFGYGQEELERAKQEELNEIRTKYAKIEQDNLDKQNEELARKEKESLERRKEMRRQFVNGVIDEMKRLSDQEEERIDQRIEAEKTLQSNLQAQANAGNISAQQSIEASKEAERKATLEKQKEQRKQQALDDIKTLYNIINQNIDKGDGVGVATTKAIAQMGIIKSVAKVFSALTGFAKGTKFRLGDEHKPMFSGVDGHVIRADSSEGIVRGDLMDKIESAGIGSMDEMAQLAISQKLNPNFYAMNDNRAVFVPVEQKQDTSRLESRLERIEQAIKDKAEISIDPIVLAGIAKGITKTERKGNFTRKEIFK